MPLRHLNYLIEYGIFLRKTNLANYPKILFRDLTQLAPLLGLADVSVLPSSLMAHFKKHHRRKMVPFIVIGHDLDNKD